MKHSVSIKTKWDKLHFWNANTYMWVFVEGRMFVINEAEYEHKNDKLNKKIYDGKFINKEKERNK
ncbi:MAG TPA: hypothetical protein PKE39_04850 [Ignavibacteria bacterium]|nr:hypothetical protein [Ignavibacteria bacterium]HMQ98332.1 hypothetical protein [Ignavibacteria bacterium]